MTRIEAVERGEVAAGGLGQPGGQSAASAARALMALINQGEWAQATRLAEGLTGGGAQGLGGVVAELAELAAPQAGDLLDRLLALGAPMWEGEERGGHALGAAVAWGREGMALSLIREGLGRGELTTARASEALRRGCARWMGAGEEVVWALLEAGADPGDRGPRAGDRSAREWAAGRPEEERSELLEALSAYDQRGELEKVARAARAEGRRGAL